MVRFVFSVEDLARTRFAISPISELAERLELSPATASHHLTALRDAGLVTGRREGRAVLYVRTPLGDALATT